MKKSQEQTKPQNAGVDSLWIKALLEGQIEKPHGWTEQEVLKLTASKPKSRIQGILQQVYWDMCDLLKNVRYIESEDRIEGPDEDHFDKWYENMELEEYTQTYKLLQFLNTILRAVDKKEVDGYGTATEVEGALWNIADRVLEDSEYLVKVADVINDKYPGLAAPFRSLPSATEMNEQEQNEYTKHITRIEKDIESNVEEFALELAKIERAKKTDFERTAVDLNQIVVFGEANWELTLYSLMSSRAPRMLINNLDYRANLHELLPGDISTAKSKIQKIAKIIAPKMVVVDEVTKATFEGLAPTRSGGEIEEGLIDWARNGSIIVEELRTSFTRMPLFRRVMDGEYIEIHKKGSSKGTYPNTTMFAACNPKEDFFIEETDDSFRKQIVFKEGVLSRFDILIPLTATQVKNEILLEKLYLLQLTAQLNGVDLEAIKENLATLAEGMSIVKRVIITKEQETQIKDAFRQQNKMDKDRRLLKYRPLVLLRDLETLARLVNTIAAVNFSRRKIKNGILNADDKDITKAIQLWENLIQLRVQLYGKAGPGTRNLRSVADEMILYIHRMQQYRQDQGLEPEVSIADLKQEFVDIRRMIGQTTFYEELKALREDGRIIQQGKRGGAVRLVIA